MSIYNDATLEEIDQVMDEAWKAFLIYRKFPLKQRAALMRTIAKELDESGDEILSTAMEETNLPIPRLRSERARTIFQLNNYAQACEEGNWLEARIDTADSNRNPPKPDIRKMLVPLGPVVVFGASNFPFAYSTAGGDTACAFAAGCPVIIKAHPAHEKTSELVAEIIRRAIQKLGLPGGIFHHIHGTGFEVGKALVEHRYTKAVGFTGSFAGGKQLFDWASQRREPIPVFAEMGSVNPVFLLPEKLKTGAEEIVPMIAQSVTLGVGQFCTNPGLIIGLESPELAGFVNDLSAMIKTVPPGAMLHTGIFKNYVEKRANVLAQETVEMSGVSEAEPQFNEGSATVAKVSGEVFLNNPILHQEVFGPFTMVVSCKDMTEMLNIAKNLEGQLTATVFGTRTDIQYHEELIEAIKNICGRFVMNGVPTGVEVCLSMQHGGPYPATTDSRFTSVGADGIKRFARPIAFQNWEQELLPEELRDSNSLKIWRTVNGEIVRREV